MTRWKKSDRYVTSGFLQFFACSIQNLILLSIFYFFDILDQSCRKIFDNLSKLRLSRSLIWPRKTIFSACFIFNSPALFSSSIMLTVVLMATFTTTLLPQGNNKCCKVSGGQRNGFSTESQDSSRKGFKMFVNFEAPARRLNISFFQFVGLSVKYFVCC